MKLSKIVFFGNERLSSGFEPQGAPTLQGLIDAGYDIAAVIANYQRGAGRKARELEIQQVAERYNIPVLLPKKLRDIANELQAMQAQVGILVAYGRIIPQSVIDIFPRGIVNVHPSLLPKYRGSTPIEQAILDGAPKTGVSIMKLVQQMDAGPLYGQTKVLLKGNETKQELTRTLLLLGRQLLLQHLPAILDGTAQTIQQNEPQATYTRLLTKDDSQLDLSKPAELLERQVRAFSGWPKSRISIFDQDIIVLTARVATSPNDGALVLTCADNSFLEITKLTASSGRTMNGADFMRGYKKDN